MEVRPLRQRKILDIRELCAITRDLQESGHQQLRQDTNNGAAAKQEPTQLSVPPSQSSSHLPARKRS